MCKQGIHYNDRFICLRGKVLLYHEIEHTLFQPADCRRREIVGNDMNLIAQLRFLYCVHTGGDAFGAHINAPDAAVPLECRENGFIGQIVSLKALLQLDSVAGDAERCGMTVKGINTAAVGEKFQISRDSENPILRTEAAGEQSGGDLPESNIEKLTGSGVDGVAVVSAIFGAENIGRATERLRLASDRMAESGTGRGSNGADE